MTNRSATITNQPVSQFRPIGQPEAINQLVDRFRTTGRPTQPTDQLVDWDF
jgi:hypothetical protein